MTASLSTNAQRLMEAVSALHTIGLNLSTRLDKGSLLRHVINCAVYLLDADGGGFICLYDPVRDELVATETTGSGGSFKGATIKPGEGLNGRVFASGTATVVDDYRLWEGRSPRFAHLDVRAMLAVPLRWLNEVVGTLGVSSKVEGRRFTPDDVQLGELFAAQATIAIVNAQLYETLDRQASHLEELVAERTAEVVRERERLKAIVESAGEGIIFADPQGCIEYVNPAWERLTGHEGRAVIGTHCMDVFGLRHDGPHSDMRERMMRGEVWEGEFHARRPDGSEYDAAATVAPVCEAEGRLVNFVAVFRDITSQQEVARMRRKLLANISHELRTPITSLKLFHTLLRSGPAERRGQYLDTMACELGRLERLVEDLLDISRLDQGVLPMRPAPMDLNQVVQEVLHTHLQSARERGLHLEVDLQAGLPPICGDRERIVQMLVHLLTNAVNYTSPGDGVGVRTWLSADGDAPMAALTVRDTGIGIAPQDLPFVFQRFFRSETARVEGIPGTGLGLSIVREIVDLHKGTIKVESAQGEGSTFTVFLPLGVETSSPGASAEPRHPL